MEAGTRLHHQLVATMLAAHPGLDVPDKQHVSLYTAMATGLARDCVLRGNASGAAHFLGVATGLLQRARADEVPGAVARLLGDTLAHLQLRAQAEVRRGGGGVVRSARLPTPHQAPACAHRA